MLIKTTVVNLKKDNYDIYVGRPSEYGNPYIIGKDGTRSQVLQLYKKDLLSNIDLMIKIKKELKGKVLGCYCLPLLCHAQLLSWLCNTLCYAIIGSRTFNNKQLLYETLDEYKIKWIVSGGAKGADSLGAEYAVDEHILLTEILPDWDTHGKSAGIKRNFKIIDLSDIVIAFWDGKSPGTKHAIEYAERTNKKVLIYGNEF